MIGRILVVLSGGIAIVGGMYQPGPFSNVCIGLAAIYTVGCFVMEV